MIPGGRPASTRQGNDRQTAYVLATAQHESRDFTSPEEDHGRKQAAVIGYRGGEDYFGRGYAHLTHADNCFHIGQALGLGRDLQDKPALAADPQMAALILVRGMRDGVFTGQGLARYITADRVDYEGARRIVNAQDRARHVAGLARKWEGQVDGLVESVRRDGVELAQRGDPAAIRHVLQAHLASDAGQAWRAIGEQQFQAQPGSREAQAPPLEVETPAMER